jgi:hypothetical protein
MACCSIICGGDLAPALQRITQQNSTPRCEPPCFWLVRDTDPNTPGLQAECVFEDHPRAPDGTFTTSTLPSCDAAAPRAGV